MSSSGGSLDTSANSHQPTLSFINSSSFFDLLQVHDQTDIKREEVCETTGGLDFPTFPPPLSPFFSVPDGLSPTHFLDSPFFLSNSNLLPSPTTEAFPPHLFNSMDEQENSGFTFKTQTNPGTISSSESIFASSMIAGETYEGQQQPYMYESFTAQANNQPTQTVKEQKQFEDGYNWRKYGQKQVKGSENPRSYYKCSFPNCPTKKIIEICLEGKITEIIYKGSHNHPKPQFTRRSSAIHPSVTVPRSQVPHEFINTHMVSSMTPENSSSSNGEDDFDGGSQRKRSGDVFDEDEQPEAKKWNEGITGSGIRAVKEAKVIVQTTSDIDILDDGYRWRKYGQKVVKGNPNPRSYYKCTSAECPVRKHVERASHDTKAVITAYEGKHNHDVPAVRGSGYHSVNRSLPGDNNSNNNTIVPIRPVAQSLPVSQGQAHFTIEMLQNRMGGNQIPEYNSSMESLINQLQRTDGSSVFSVRKEEPRKDFLESFLC